MKFHRLKHRARQMPDWRCSGFKSFVVGSVAALLSLPVAVSTTVAQTGSIERPDSARPSPIGVWLDDTGQGAIEIAPCGEMLCGRIVWLKEPLTKEGEPLTDALNPDPSRRERPICGLQIIGDLKRQPNGSWDKGWIYDPKEGKSYDVEIRLRDPDRLQVKGYLGVKFLSETFIWQRAPAELPRCSA